MAPRLRSFVSAILLAGAAMVTAASGQTRAQSLNDGWEALNNKYKGASGRVREFFRGGRFSPDDKSDLEAIDLYAKVYTYGVYLQKRDTVPGAIVKDFKEFENDLSGVAKGKGSQGMQPLADALSDAIALHALEVIQLKEARSSHKLQNARLLAKAAELGHAKLSDTLVTVLKDPQQNDGVYYYVLKGMSTLLAQGQLLNKDQQTKCAEAIIAFLEQKKGPAKNAGVGEIDGFRLLRREAVRALAKIHTPEFGAKVRPALVLARFAGNDERIQPPPRIDERVEAAISLAQMQPTKDTRYQPEYAAGHIAKCLGALAQAATNENANANTKSKIHAHPWKTMAAMLQEALTVLKSNNAKSAYVSQVADRGSRLLDRVKSGANTDNNERVWWLSPQSDPPANIKELFQGSADSTVKPAPPAEAAPEK